MATSFSGGRSRREQQTMGKQLVNFITCDCDSSAPFFVIYKAERIGARLVWVVRCSNYLTHWATRALGNIGHKTMNKDKQHRKLKRWATQTHRITVSEPRCLQSVISSCWFFLVWHLLRYSKSSLVKVLSVIKLKVKNICVRKRSTDIWVIYI